MSLFANNEPMTFCNCKVAPLLTNPDWHDIADWTVCQYRANIGPVFPANIGGIEEKRPDGDIGPILRHYCLLQGQDCNRNCTGCSASFLATGWVFLFHIV